MIYTSAKNEKIVINNSLSKILSTLGITIFSSLLLFLVVLIMSELVGFELRMKKPQVNTAFTQRVLEDTALKKSLMILKNHEPVRCNKNADFCDQGLDYNYAVKDRDNALERLGCKRIDFWFVHVPAHKVECAH
jgi:hypothetical protein